MIRSVIRTSSKMKLLILIIVLQCIWQFQAIDVDNSKKDVLPTKLNCGYQHSDAIIHLPHVKVFDFPWVVFIPLKSRVYNPDANIRCAGTLISSRYVVISKSCLQFALTKVHLGVHNSKNATTCDEYDQCSPVLELGVEERVIDEKRDIVLLRLDQDVEFTDKIRPICLPFADVKKAEPGAIVHTSGWGLTSYEGHDSDSKKNVIQTLISNEDCEKSGVIKDVSDKNVICVKVQEDSVDQPCSGDEGSPIMYDVDHQWILGGVLTSLFDSIDRPCSIKNPARGVRISDEVLQWIVEKVHA